MSDDLSGMQCNQWIEAISARADGEAAGVDERLLNAHLAHCDSCRSFASAILLVWSISSTMTFTCLAGSRGSLGCVIKSSGCLGSSGLAWGRGSRESW